MQEKEFEKLNLSQKYQLVRKEGAFLASRFFQGYNVHLFRLRGLWVEVWTLIALQQVRWIELLKNPHALEEYADQVNIDDLSKDR